MKDICKTGQANGYTCPGGKTVFSSSIVWGAIGPARSYSIGTIYSGLLHFFWIGAIAPVVSWGVWKYWKKADGSSRDYLKWLNWPIIFIVSPSKENIIDSFKSVRWLTIRREQSTSPQQPESTIPAGLSQTSFSTGGSRRSTLRGGPSIITFLPLPLIPVLLLRRLLFSFVSRIPELCFQIGGGIRCMQIRLMGGVWLG